VNISVTVTEGITNEDPGVLKLVRREERDLLLVVNRTCQVRLIEQEASPSKKWKRDEEGGSGGDFSGFF